MVRIDVHLDDKSEWVKVFDPRDQAIFVALDEPPEVGDAARIDLSIADSGPRVILRGKVIARRPTAEGSMPAGCFVALGPEEREKINYLNGFVRGGLLNLRERRRLPLRLEVTYGGINGPQKTYTRDLNEEGVFIVSEKPLPEDSEIHILLTIPGRSEPLSLTGVVSHTVVVEDEDVPGMGVVFSDDDAESAALARIVDDLEQKFLSGTLPEDVLL